MKIEIVYPQPKKQQTRHMANIIKWCFVAAACICPFINFLVGGKPWSVIVIWSLWCVWSLVISRDLIEYNRISQTSKLLLDICILLILIEVFLSSGWAEFVIPIVSFASLNIIGVLFFTNLSKQKQNLMPMVWLIAAALVAITAALIGWPELNWPVIVLGATALALLLVTFIIMPKELLREFKKRFHLR